MQARGSHSHAVLGNAVTARTVAVLVFARDDGCCIAVVVRVTGGGTWSRGGGGTCALVGDFEG